MHNGDKAETNVRIKNDLIDPKLFCNHCGFNGEPNGCNNPDGLCHAWNNADAAYVYIKQLECERDAAVKDLNELMAQLQGQVCNICKKCNTEQCDYTERLYHRCHPVWRGVEESK